MNRITNDGGQVHEAKDVNAAGEQLIRSGLILTFDRSSVS